MRALLPLLLASLPALTHARKVPANVRAFYDRVKPGRCEGDDLLQGGFYAYEGSKAAWSYCRAPLPGTGSAIFLHGPSTFANMDIDCDGSRSRSPRCKASRDTQSTTSFSDLIHQYSGGAIDDVDASVVPYVVLGNVADGGDGGDGKGYWPRFKMQDHGVSPLSVVAVVCGEKLVYGIWADENGDDGDPLVGEASLALATECFGDSVDGDRGYDDTDVLYVAFTGEDAVPGKSAEWEAKNFGEFEASIAALGDRLVKRLG